MTADARFSAVQAASRKGQDFAISGLKLVAKCATALPSIANEIVSAHRAAEIGPAGLAPTDRLASIGK